MSPTTLTFPAASWRLWQAIDLNAAADVDEMDERETLTLTAKGGGYDGLTYSLDVTIKYRPAHERAIPEGQAIVIGLNLTQRGRLTHHK